MAELTPIEPGDAVERYLRVKEPEFAHSTFNANRSRLGFFVDWCHDQEIHNMNDLTGRHIHDFQISRREDLNPVSENTQMATVRRFVEWCETIDAVEPGLAEDIYVPTVKEGASSEVTLDADEAQRILDHLETYEYATIDHVCWVILANTGCRLGSVRALDLDDYEPESDPPYLYPRHRPESDTPLKNGVDGERPVAIPDDAAKVIDDYLEHKRPDVTDEYGRDPLLASPHGRLAGSTIRKHVYKWSRPCAIGLDCPHDRNQLECDAWTNIEHAARCPSSVTPHPIRRGYITKLLTDDVPPNAVSDRCDVSQAVIERHYDVRTEETKMRQRHRLIQDATADG